MTIPIIGHRAAPLHAPENSLAGIRKAAELGANGVEIDIRRAIDGVPMVFHDATLRAHTGWPGPIQLYPSFLLRRLRIDGSDERIPTLEQALDVAPEGFVYMLDLKDAGAAASTLRVVRKLGAQARVQFWSKEDRALRYLGARAPEVPRALLRNETDPEGLRAFFDSAERLDVEGMSVDWRAITPQLLGEAHERGRCDRTGPARADRAQPRRGPHALGRDAELLPAAQR